MPKEVAGLPARVQFRLAAPFVSQNNGMTVGVAQLCSIERLYLHYADTAFALNHRILIRSSRSSPWTRAAAVTSAS